jgi:hypothetical protein
MLPRDAVEWTYALLRDKTFFLVAVPDTQTLFGFRILQEYKTPQVLKVSPKWNWNMGVFKENREPLRNDLFYNIMLFATPVCEWCGGCRDVALVAFCYYDLYHSSQMLEDDIHCNKQTNICAVCLFKRFLFLSNVVELAVHVTSVVCLSHECTLEVLPVGLTDPPLGVSHITRCLRI